jgi:hypothetical protein
MKAGMTNVPNTTSVSPIHPKTSFFVFGAASWTTFSVGPCPMCHVVSKEKQNPHKGEHQSGNIHRCSVHVAYTPFMS